jgi:hypothetical protein
MAGGLLTGGDHGYLTGSWWLASSGYGSSRGIVQREGCDGGWDVVELSAAHVRADVWRGDVGV